MFFRALWACHTSAIYETRFTPFQFAYGLEVVLPIEFEISSLKLAVKLLYVIFAEEEHVLYLARLYETHHDDALASETHKKRVKAHFD